MSVQLNPRPQNRLRKTKSPCPCCFLHLSLCLCDQIPHLNIKTRVSLIIHRRELKRTTNTGQLALRALVNSQMFVRGEGSAQQSGVALDLSSLVQADLRPLLLFPSEDARELTSQLVAEDPRPVHLIVPDGNWRQASKVHTRHPELQSLPRVKLVTRQGPESFLRRESRPEGMATLQAIALAMTVIEGPAIGNQLFELYQLKLTRTLMGRGHKEIKNPR